MPIVDLWSPPPGGVIKLNVDVGVQSHEQTTCLGAVAHDSSRAIIFSTSKIVPNSSSTLEAKIKAIHFGLALVVNHGFTTIILESDCLVAIKEIK